MSRMSRNKGSRGERAVRDILRAYGFEAHRVPMSGGHAIPGDLMHTLPDTHCEVKYAERWSLPAWIKQSQKDCPEGKAWTVIFRSNRQPWLIVLELEDYLQQRGYTRTEGE